MQEQRRRRTHLGISRADRDLFSTAMTVGLAYAGPTWEYSDGSDGGRPGRRHGPRARSQSDIPWLKLGVTSGGGSGALSPATTVQRINTAGGKLNGACYKAGTYESVPYSADYVFLRKG
jgi:hypothetical protein